IAVRTAAFWALPENRFYLPFHTFHGVFSWLAFATAATAWWVEGRHRLNILGGFILPLTWLAAAAALCGDTAAGSLPAGLRSGWMNVHPLILMAGYAVLANAFGVGLAFLIQERQV